MPRKTTSESHVSGKYKRILKGSLFALWVIFFLSGVAGTLFYLQNHSLSEGISLLRDFLEQKRELLVLLILGLYLVRTIIFIPVSVLGGLIGVFLSGNLFLAISLGVVGSMMSALLSFWIARKLGRKWVAAHETPRLKHFDEKVRARGFFTIFILRVLIFIPFDLINLASGFSSIRFRDYAWGSFLGIIPEVAFQVLLGNSIGEIFEKSFLSPKTIALFLVIGVGLYALGRFLKTHPHFKDLLHPIEQIQKIRAKRRQKKKDRKRMKRY